MDNKYLTCPNCEQKIFLEELFNHDSQVFNDFIDDKVANKLEKATEEKLIADRAKIEKEFLEKLRILEVQSQKEISSLKLNLNDYQNKIKQIEASKTAEILNKEKDTQLLFNQKIKELELKINNFESEEKNLKLKFETDLANKMLEIEKAHTNKIDSLNLQIRELEQANLRLRIIDSKSKGENFELEVEKELRKAFGYLDKIEKITTGDKKADYLQTVRNSQGKDIGKIVYEVKNAKWSDAWLPKLSVDVSNNKTKYGILVATSFNDKYKSIPFIRSDEWVNIWMSDSESFIFVGQIVRRLIEIEFDFEEKRKLLIDSNDSKDSKLLKEYEEKINLISTFMTEELPKFIRSFKKQLGDIDSVKNSLNKNADTLAKAHSILKDKLEKEIIIKLEAITGIRGQDYDSNE
ncbi:DUF2130 domain-containing protein [Spiroplasma endosymbiont of Aspidapion aeneum]|uniref:DUF2130 domain-containing protein n=1 Tax=Spiroplasma endosymbiont of Aspidapion aeneum TaxID=3066276 RepID=UPI00313EA343